MTREKRNPAGGNGGARKSSTWARDHHKCSPDTRITSPTADEVYERSVIEAAAELGYTVAVPCQVCGHPLTHPKSVVAQVGPKCAGKAGEQ
ncbi:DUF6011 domain-containing protein [Gordonia sp. DT219]|uniref:DUF6011 domain-containing protein n=1 Tax=Gordonia sp. DT219 TaxID=3416658 RepID=UPI003CE83C0F